MGNETLKIMKQFLDLFLLAMLLNFLAIFAHFLFISKPFSFPTIALIARVVSQWIQCSQPLAGTLIDAPAMIILMTMGSDGLPLLLADLTHVSGTICYMKNDWCAIARHRFVLEPSGFLASIPSNNIAAS